MRSPNIAELQSRATAIIADLDRFKSDNGLYPQTLIEACALTAVDHYQTRYGASEDRKHCELAIGDYERDGFVMIWTSTDHKWAVDD
jgi:hypothetical protein